MSCVLFGSSIKVTAVKQKVYIVTEYIGLNHNSTAYYWAKIAVHFNEIFDLQVICPRNHYTEVFFSETGIAVTYVKDLGLDKNRLLTRVLGQLKYAWSLNRNILTAVSKNDVVFTGTNPIIGVFFTALLKKFKGFNWLVLCHDIFPNNLIPSGVMQPGFKYRFLEKLFAVVYKTPDAIAPIGRDMAAMLINKGVRQDRVHVIPNWADHEVVQVTAKEDNPIIQKLGWQDKIVFCFFGNIGRLQGIPNLLAGLALVKSENARFLIIGGGAEKAKVVEFVRRSGGANTHYYGELELKDNNLGLNCGDVALVTLGKGMFGLGVPSKAYFSMAADKPILLVADQDSELDLLIKEYPLGWSCPSGDPAKLAQKIDEICVDFADKQSQFTPRKTMVDNFSEHSSLHKYAGLVSILGNDSSDNH